MDIEIGGVMLTPPPISFKKRAAKTMSSTPARGVYHIALNFTDSVHWCAAPPRQ